MFKRKQGVTLIALIVTIIILLILASVTITTLGGGEGLFNRARQAGTETRAASVEERKNMWVLEIEMAKYAGGEVANVEEILARLQQEGLLTAEEVAQILDEENTNMEVEIGSKTISFKTEISPSTDVIGDGSFINGVNSPILGEGMTAIVYDNTVTSTSGNIPEYWRKAKNEVEWYNYASQKWANAVTEDGSMWVWIPRYQYKINSVAQTIAVEFIPTSQTTATNGYTYVHPAFRDGRTTNFMNGEWNKELSGIWVAKFEASKSDATSVDEGEIEVAKIQPDVRAWTKITIGDSYTESESMYAEYNSHLMKNSEWGAMVYLSHSSFGRNGTEIGIRVVQGIQQEYLTSTEEHGKG